mmetsp:Transcript_17157/g.36815  ORF Transcript_17157/g.36815 Transcript_17157/m.36815 type:complete len:231 (+) Transcript_17157:463-1155(+)
MFGFHVRTKALPSGVMTSRASAKKTNVTGPTPSLVGFGSHASLMFLADAELTRAKPRRAAVSLRLYAACFVLHRKWAVRTSLSSAGRVSTGSARCSPTKKRATPACLQPLAVGTAPTFFIPAPGTAPRAAALARTRAPPSRASASLARTSSCSRASVSSKMRTPAPPNSRLRKHATTATCTHPVFNTTTSPIPPPTFRRTSPSASGARAHAAPAARALTCASSPPIAPSM